MAEALDLQETSEKASSFPAIRIILQRHGETDRTRPKADASIEDKEKAGWLTPEGVKQTRGVAREKIEEILDEGKPVTFFFINSPSVWFSEGLQYGKRAEQTVRVSAETAQKVIEEKGLTPEQAEIHEFKAKKSQNILHDSPIVAEPDLYFVPNSKHPTVYIDAMREKYGKDWEAGFHKMEKDLEEVRKLAGAQSSAEVGESTLNLFKAIEKYAQKYADVFQGRELVFWVDTHGDRLRSTLQYGLGAGQEAEGHLFKENEFLDLRLKNGVVSTQFNGRELARDLNE